MESDTSIGGDYGALPMIFFAGTCDAMAAQGYFAHDSACMLVSNINTLYPGSCTGAASCACVGGSQTCGAGCTAWYQRIGLFGANAMGEIIASSTDPNGAFYQWLYE